MIAPYQRARRIAMCARLLDWSGVAGHVEQCKAHGQRVSVYTQVLTAPDERTVMVAVHDELTSGAAEIETRDIADAARIVERMRFYGAEVTA